MKYRYNYLLKEFNNFEGYKDSINIINNTQIEINKWDEVKSKNTSKHYNEYIQQYPNGIYIEEAKKLYNVATDNEAWEKAKKEDTQKAYEEYLKEFKDGIHKNEAQDKINYFIADEEAWQKISNRLERKTGLKKILAYIILLGMAYPVWFVMALITLAFNTKNILIVHLSMLVLEYFVSYKIILYLLDFNYVKQKKLFLFLKKPIKIVFILLLLLVLYTVLVIYYYISSKIIPEEIYFLLSVVIIFYVLLLIYLYVLYYLKKKFYRWYWL